MKLLFTIAPFIPLKQTSQHQKKEEGNHCRKSHYITSFLFCYDFIKTVSKIGYSPWTNVWKQVSEITLQLQLYVALILNIVGQRAQYILCVFPTAVYNVLRKTHKCSMCSFQQTCIKHGFCVFPLPHTGSAQVEDMIPAIAV